MFAIRALALCATSAIAHECKDCEETVIRKRILARFWGLISRGLPWIVSMACPATDPARTTFDAVKRALIAR